MNYRATELTLYSEVKTMDLNKETLEGIINGADTSTATEKNPEELEGNGINLSNTTVPTQEEEDNANIDNGDIEAPNPDADVDNPHATPDSTPSADLETGNEQGTDIEQSSDLNSEPNAEPVADPEGVSSESALGGDNTIAVDDVPEAQATKTFTQSQVDEIAGKVRKETREKLMRDLYSRYGVNTADELDDLIGDAQRFATSQDDFAAKEKAWNEQDALRNQELQTVKERVALLESGIDNGRFEDARLILKGKGLEVTAENIAAELATHPEWKKQDPTPVEQSGLPFMKTQAPVDKPTEAPSQISIPTLGNNSADNPQPELSERERALKMFKV